MRSLVWKRMFALVMLVLLLQSPAGAQGIGGDAKGSGEEETSQSDIVGPCQLENPSDITDEEEAGLVGRRAYESPLFGYEVEWTRDWGLDTYFETPVVSKPDMGEDDLCLYWSDDDDAYGYVYVIGQEEGRGGADADVEDWTDPDFIDEQWPAYDVTVLLDDTSRGRGGVVYLLEDIEEGYLYVTEYQAIEREDGSTLYLTFSTAAAYLEVSYPAAAEGITVDGESVFSLFDVDDILEAIDQ